MKAIFVIIVFIGLVQVEESALVEDNGPDVLGKVSDVIAPHGCCAGYEANCDKLHDTRRPGEGEGSIDTEKNKEKITTADVT
jgi:hypothetical protein